MQFVLLDSDSVDEQVMNVVNDGVLVVSLRNQFQHILVILTSHVEPDDIQTVVEES